MLAAKHIAEKSLGIIEPMLHVGRIVFLYGIKDFLTESFIEILPVPGIVWKQECPILSQTMIGVKATAH